jgi:hypothetical protein
MQGRVFIISNCQLDKKGRLLIPAPIRATRSIARCAKAVPSVHPLSPMPTSARSKTFVLLCVPHSYLLPATAYANAKSRII